MLYKEKIEFALFKLTQNIINTYKLYNVGNSIEDLQQEVIEHLLQKMHLFNPELGKAYSYFGTITKRYFLAKNKKAYVRMIEHVDIDPMYLESINTTYAESFDVEPYDLDSIINEFIETSNKKLPELFPDSLEYSIASNVLYLFKSIDKIEFFNKKAMLLYLRELNPGADNNKINSVLKTLYSIYKEINFTYLSD